MKPHNNLTSMWTTNFNYTLSTTQNATGIKIDIITPWAELVNINNTKEIKQRDGIKIKYLVTTIISGNQSISGLVEPNLIGKSKEELIENMEI